jgi:hypothetical protein
MIGAHILREHHRLLAVPVSGAAFFCVGRELNVLAFAEYIDGQVVAGQEGFHSWIECNGHVIDLLAPLFPENVAEVDTQTQIPRRAFIKPLSAMASRLPEKGDPEGTFLLIPDEMCQANMVRNFYRKPVAGDLQAICTSWYRRSPKPIDRELLIRDNHGQIEKLKRQDIGIRGFW